MTDVRIRFEGDSKDAVRAAKDVDTAIGGIDETSGRTGTALRGLGVVALGALGGLALVAKAGWDELAEGEIVAAQTGAALKSTGGIANVTEQEIGDLATTLSKLSGIDDELIQKGENLLLTFKNVRNEVGEGNRVFDRATAAALDLSVAGFGSVESTSKQLGKALQDPIRGMTALGRAGVTFSEEQKETIKQLVETGHTLEAQKIILAEVESQVGGSAKAYGETLPGQLAKARVQFEEMAANLTTALLPALNAFASVANTVFGFLAEHTTTTQILAGVIGTLAVGVLALNVAQKAWAVGTGLVTAATAAWTAVQWLLNVALTAIPIGIVVVAIAALVAGLILAWQHSETFRAIVTGAFDAVKAAAAAVATFLTEKIPAAFKAVLDWVRENWKTIAVLISGPFAPIVLLATDAFGVRSALVGAFNAVRTFISGVIDAIVGFFVALPGRLLATIAALVGTALAAFRSAFAAAKTFVGNQVDDVVDFFVKLPGRIADTLGALAGQAIQPFKALFRSAGDAVEFVNEGIRWLRENAVKIISAVVEKVKGPFAVLAAALAPVEAFLGQILAFLEGIRDKAGDFVAAIDKIIGAIGKIPSLPSLPSLPFGIGERQHGGPVLAGMPYLVGEKGPEIILPRSPGTVIPNSALRSSASVGGMTLVVQVQGDFIGDRAYVEHLATLLAPQFGRVAMYESRV